MAQDETQSVCLATSSEAPTPRATMAAYRLDRISSSRPLNLSAEIQGQEEIGLATEVERASEQEKANSANEVLQ